MLHIDIPTLAEFKALAAIKGETCVSLYLPTEPLRERERANRTALEDLATAALRQLKDAEVDKRRVAALEAQLLRLIDPHRDDPEPDKIRKLQNLEPNPIDAFWQFQGHGLAVLATPDSLRTFRMSYPPKPLAEATDRFHLTPLIRAMTSPQDIYVLALAENNVRLVRAFVNLPPVRIHIPDLPDDAEAVAHRASIHERNPKGRLQGSEGTKVLLHEFAQRVDHALHGVLAGRAVPLVLAADEPLAAIYRSVNTHPALLDDVIPGNPSHLSDAQLEEAALPILDRLYERQLKTAVARFDELKPRRATTDVSFAAHAVTAGAVDELLVDFDAMIPGIVSDADGSVTYSAADEVDTYDVVDEIARRALATDARVLGARREDLPEGAPLVAILRYEFGPH
jgi:hypothetical protein